MTYMHQSFQRSHNYIMGKGESLENTVGNYMQKNIKLDPNLTLYTQKKVNSRYIKHLTIRPKAIRHRKMVP